MSTLLGTIRSAYKKIQIRIGLIIFFVLFAMESGRWFGEITIVVTILLYACLLSYIFVIKSCICIKNGGSN